MKFHSLILSAMLTGAALLATGCTDHTDRIFDTTARVVAFDVDTEQPEGSRSASEEGPAETFSTLTLTGDDGSTLYLHALTREGITPSAAPAGRAAAVTTETLADMGVWGASYQGDTWTGSDFYMKDVELTRSGNWNSDYLWITGETMNFYAHSPYQAKGLTVAPTGKSEAPAWSYTVPADVAAQSDLLWAENVGTAFRNRVPLTFHHALTAVKFVNGALRPGRIKAIRVKGVYTSGEYHPGADSWTELQGEGNFAIALDKEVEMTLGSAVTEGETTLMMLPQTLPADATVEVDYEDATTGTASTFSARLGGTVWPMGKTVTYRIANADVMPVIEVTQMPEAIGYRGGAASFSIRSHSYRQGYGTYYTNQPWTATFYAPDASGEFTTEVPRPDWLADFPTEGDGTDNGTAHSYDFNISPTPVVITNEVDDALASTPATTSPVDLSMTDVNGNATAEMNTANCYVVRSAGTYRIPVVFGNAIKHSRTNTNAYTATVPEGSTTMLPVMLDAFNQPITSPFIEGATGAKGIWNVIAPDVITVQPALVTEQRVIDGVSRDVQYLQFTINKASLKQGNLGVAVTNADGTILWSWHIWVTTLEFSTKQVWNYAGQVNEVANVNMAWCTGDCWTYPERRIKVRFTQPATGAYVETMIVTQQEFVSQKPGNNMMYMWGRKDPMRALLPNNESKTVWDGEGNVIPTTQIQNWPNRATFIGRSIQSPTTFFKMNTTGIATWANLWAANSDYVALDASVAWPQNLVKTVYDPCPAGFQVSTSAAFTGYSNKPGAQTGTGDKIYQVGDVHDGIDLMCRPADTSTDPATLFYPTTGTRNNNFNVQYKFGDGFMILGAEGRLLTNTTETATGSAVFQYYRGMLWTSNPRTIAAPASVRPCREND